MRFVKLLRMRIFRHIRMRNVKLSRMRTEDHKYDPCGLNFPSWCVVDFAVCDVGLRSGNGCSLQVTGSPADSVRLGNEREGLLEAAEM